MDDLDNIGGNDSDNVTEDVANKSQVMPKNQNDAKNTGGIVKKVLDNTIFIMLAYNSCRRQ